MICQACRQEIHDGARYCGKCGAKQPADSPGVPAPASGKVSIEADTATGAPAGTAILDPAAPPSLPIGAIAPAPEVAAAAARWKIVGGTLFAIGLIGACVMRFVSGLVQGYDLAFTLIGLLITALLLAGFVGVYHARKLRAVAAATLLAHDPRPPVLYLRSFKHDNTTLGRALRSLYLPLMVQTFFTVEEQLAEVLGAVGPVVAIGRPGEKLPEAGAARLYVDDDQWQQVVIDFMRRARLVVLRAGKSAGLRWEIEQSALSLPPERLMFFVLSGRREYNTFRKNANMYLLHPLPAYRQINRLGLGQVRAFILFEPDWAPRVHRLRYPWYRGSVTKALKPVFQMALQPVFTRFGVDWQPPRVGWATKALLPFLGLIAIALVGAVVYTSLRSAPRPLVPTGLAPVATSAPAVVWRQFTSTSGKFSIAMPGQPEEKRQTVETRAGSIDLVLLTFSPDATTSYMAAYNDYPAEIMDNADPGKLLGGVLKQLVGSFEGKLLSSERITIDTYPGLAFTATVSEHKLLGGGVVQGTIALVGPRLYQVYVLSADDPAANARRERFLKSFALLRK